MEAHDNRKSALLSCIDSFAFEGELSESPHVLAGDQYCPDEEAGTNRTPPRSGGEKTSNANGLVDGHEGPLVHRDEVRVLQTFLASASAQSCRSQGMSPFHFSEQLRAIIDTGARGTVEDFHAFLVDLRSIGQKGHFASLCAAMLSVQTRDQATLTAVKRLLSKLGSGKDQKILEPAKIAEASINDLEVCLAGVNYHKTKSKQLRAIADIIARYHEGVVPDDFDTLVSLPGVGPKIANLVRSVTFGRVKGCGMVVDTHVHRIAQRLGWTFPRRSSGDPEHTRRCLEKFIPEEVRELVTRRLIGFGQEVCLPQNPRCKQCRLAAAGVCPSAKGDRPIQATPPMTPRFKGLASPAASRGMKRVIIELE